MWGVCRLLSNSLWRFPFRRYRAFRDETCGSFVYARPYRRSSASGLSRCAGRLKTREVGEQMEAFEFAKREDFRRSKMEDYYARKMRWLLRLFWNSGDLSISCTKCDLWCKKMSETFVLKIWADFGNKLKVLTAYSAQKEPILGKLSRAVGALQREKTKDFAIFRRYLAYLQRFTIL